MTRSLDDSILACSALELGREGCGDDVLPILPCTATANRPRVWVHGLRLKVFAAGYQRGCILCSIMCSMIGLYRVFSISAHVRKSIERQVASKGAAPRNKGSKGAATRNN